MSDNDLSGTNIGSFRIEARIGEGGMGVVYRADDLALKRKVAVKVLAPSLIDRAESRARFQDEIKHSVSIEHPHVVPVYSAGYEDGHFYLVMRLVDGPDLARVLDARGPLPEPRALRLI